MVLVRSFLFPQTDPFVLFLATALLVLALDQLAAPRLGREVAIVVVLTAGLFTKLSFLPALALLPLWRVVEYGVNGEWSNSPLRRATIRQVSLDCCLYVLVPATVFIGYQSWVGSLDLYAHEFGQMVTEDSTITNHTLSLAFTGGIFGLLIYLRRTPLDLREWLLAAWVVLYLVSLWAADTSGWSRFYLPVLPALALLAAPGLVRIRQVAGDAAIWGFVVSVAALNYLALALRLYI